MSDPSTPSGKADVAAVMTRREARVLLLNATVDSVKADPRVLSDEQKAAAEQLHALLRAIADEKEQRADKPKGLRRFLPGIDETRRNHNLLIDGGRGSGKTALLVTMLDVWNHLCDPAVAVTLDVDDRAAKRKAWGIVEGEWPVVPIGLVDLQPLPGHMPVILHLVERLERVVEAIEDGVETADDPPPWHLAPEKAVTARTEWNTLLQCIVARWDFAARKRWGKVDTESAFHELDRSVREHHDLTTRFARFVDALAVDFKKRFWGGRKSQPLFVLAIDDADMSIDRTAEVLEALRLLHHPRLAFVVTGHSELFVRAGEQSVAKKLDKGPYASALARDIYNKVFPPSHRCALPPIDVGKRAEYLKPIARLSLPKNNEDDVTLTLGDVLNSPLVAPALPDRLRALLDLNELGRADTDADVDRALVRVALYLWEYAHPPTTFAGAVYAEGGGRHIRVSPPDRSSGMELVARASRTSSPRQHGSEKTRVVFAYDHFAQLNPESDATLPVAAVVFLASALAFERGERRYTTKLSHRSGYRTVAAAGLWEQQGYGEARFAWPLPKGRRIYELINLCLRWNRYAGTIPAGALDNDDALDRAARWYVALAFQLSPYEKKPLVAPDGDDANAPTWEALASRSVTLLQAAQDGDVDAAPWREWARERVLLLAAPESCLPATSANTMLEAWKGLFPDDTWQDIVVRVREARIERARIALERTDPKNLERAVADVLRDIDAQTPDHPWHTHIRALSPSAAPDARASFLQAMRRVGFVSADGGAAALPGELDAPALELLQELTREIPTDSLGDDRPFLATWMWNRVASQLGFQELNNVISTNEEGRASIRELPGRFHTQTRALRILGLVASEVGPYALWSAGRELPPLLRFLYETFWDWIETTTEHATWRTPLHGDEARWTWRLAGAQRFGDRTVEIPWMTTPGNTFAQLTAESARWTRVALDRWDRAGTRFVPDTFRAEQLALQYLWTSGRFYDRPGGAVPENIPSDLRSGILQVLQEVLKINLEQPIEVRRTAQRDRWRWWAQGIGLLFAPESCAPPRFRTTLCALLVDMLGRHSSTKLREPIADVAALHELRRDRLAYALARTSPPITRGVDELLAELDASGDASDWRTWIALLAGMSPP